MKKNDQNSEQLGSIRISTIHTASYTSLRSRVWISNKNKQRPSCPKKTNHYFINPKTSNTNCRSVLFSGKMFGILVPEMSNRNPEGKYLQPESTIHTEYTQIERYKTVITAVLLMMSRRGSAAWRRCSTPLAPPGAAGWSDNSVQRQTGGRW